MKLTHSDIENKKFDRQMRGYSINDVDDFLDQIIDNYKKLETEVDQLQEKLKYFDSLNSSINQSVVMAQERSNQILEEATEKNKKLDIEAQKLRNSARDFNKKLILMLEDELKNLKSQDWNELLDPINSKLFF